jgi:CRISPR system Cascade subunit CasA
MKTASFNLVDELWIPVTLADGFPGRTERSPAPRVSLREAFEHGGRIVDLRCYPHERIALMRLLICIAQRALDGPATEEEWQTCRADFAGKAVDYLEKNRDCFDLLGDGPRFLQARGSSDAGEVSVFRLRLIDKEGPALFDAHVQPETCMPREDLAVALVTYQSFAAGGWTGANIPDPDSKRTKKGDVKKVRESVEAGLCREGSSLHGFVLGQNMLNTVWLNMVCRSEIPAPMTWRLQAKPVWETGCDKSSDYPERDFKTEYLGRLVPLSRAIWLHDNLQTAELASGLRYGVFSDSKDQKTKRIKPGTHIREVSASIRLVDGKDDKPRLVSASEGGGVPKAAWRELHAVAVLGHSEKRGGPVALNHLRSSPDQELRLWCGALVGDQAKVVDVIESVFRFPSSLLEDADTAEVEDPKQCPGPNRTYRKGVDVAGDWEKRLRNAVKKYRKRLKDQDKGGGIQNRAATRYWTVLEQKAQPVLLHAVAVGGEGFIPGDKFWMAKSPWGIEVIRAARDAYEFACPHSTPKQLRAYAAGLRALFRKAAEKSADNGQEEESDSSDEEAS